jgi:hypothetical protein
VSIGCRKPITKVHGSLLCQRFLRKVTAVEHESSELEVTRLILIKYRLSDENSQKFDSNFETKITFIWKNSKNLNKLHYFVSKPLQFSSNEEQK